MTTTRSRPGYPSQHGAYARVTKLSESGCTTDEDFQETGCGLGWVSGGNNHSDQ